MQGEKKLTVALVDWYAAGHHKTYARKFYQALSRLGFRVVPVLPFDILELRERQGDLQPVGATVSFGEKTSNTKFTRSCLRKLAPNTRLPQQIYRTWRLTSQLKRWEKLNGQKIAHVFFACIYDRDFLYISYTSALLKRDWSGLYLHAKAVHALGEKLPGGGRVRAAQYLFGNPRCKGVGLLDEGAIPAMRAALGPKKRIVQFPDIADCSLPEDRNERGTLAHSLTAFAQGRPIVALMGHLQPSKGVELFTELITDSRLKDVCFFLGGPLARGNFTAKQLSSLQAVWNSQQNLFHHLEPIVEPTYNSVFSLASSIFAVYKDFPNSSNTLTKAAYFGIPIVVAKEHLMGDRVRRYQLGIAISGSSLKEAVDAVLQTTTDEKWRNSFTNSSQRTEYLRYHSETMLENAFTELLLPTTLGENLSSTSLPGGEAL